MLFLGLYDPGPGHSFVLFILSDSGYLGKFLFAAITYVLRKRVPF